MQISKDLLKDCFENVNIVENSVNPHQMASSEKLFESKTTGLDKQKLSIFSYPSVLAYVLGAQKNRLNETVLFSTHNICFG